MLLADDEAIASPFDRPAFKDALRARLAAADGPEQQMDLLRHAQHAEVFRILLPRYLLGIALAVLCRLFLPVPEIYRPALIIPFLGPVATAAPAFTAQLKGDHELASAVNSCSILVSVALITAALLLFS